MTANFSRRDSTDVLHMKLPTGASSPCEGEGSLVLSAVGFGNADTQADVTTLRLSHEIFSSESSKFSVSA